MSEKGDPRAEVEAKIAELDPFADVAAQLHQTIMDAAPDLEPRLWYGMPGYAREKRSPVLCFFRVDGPDYVTFGLTEKANHAPAPDASHQLMQSAWFLTVLDDQTKVRVTEIVKNAVGPDSDG